MIRYTEEQQIRLHELLSEKPNTSTKALAMMFGVGVKQMAGFLRRCGYRKGWIYVGYEEKTYIPTTDNKTKPTKYKAVKSKQKDNVSVEEVIDFSKLTPKERKKIVIERMRNG